MDVVSAAWTAAWKASVCVLAPVDCIPERDEHDPEPCGGVSTLGFRMMDFAIR